jgi:DNA polymerase I-like protein with 3'-5' exonuclease and polymerase domains
MEKAGVRIDTTALSSLSDKFSSELTRVGERIFELAGERFNINSPKQLGIVLFTKLGLPAPPAAAKTRPSPPRSGCAGAIRSTRSSSPGS